VYPLQLLIPFMGLLMALAYIWCFAAPSSKAWLAVVQNPDAAQLMGINVTGTIAVAYGCRASSLAGRDVDCPLFNVSSDMGTLFVSRPLLWRSSVHHQRLGVMLAGCRLRHLSKPSLPPCSVPIHQRRDVHTGHHRPHVYAPRLFGRAGVKKV